MGDDPRSAGKITGRILLAFILLAAGVLYWKWDSVALLVTDDPTDPAAGDIQAGPPAVRVITTPVRMKANHRIFEALGTGRAQQSVTIYAAVAEQVTGINFEAGDKVNKGDLLVELDDREEKLALELAEVKLQKAQSLLERYELAIQDGAVPESEVDAARTALKVARVELRQARLALNDRRIVAPISGVMGLARVDPGDRVDPNTPITVLDNRMMLQVDFQVPEMLAAALSLGQTITASTPAYPQIKFRGRIQSWESRINPETRTVLVRAGIDNQTDLLRPGMSFVTRLEIEGDPHPAVPEISLQWGRDGAFVWIIRDAAAQKIAVNVVARAGGWVLLEGDLVDDEAVVVEGVQRLAPGLKVVQTQLNEALESVYGPQ